MEDRHGGAAEEREQAGQCTLFLQTSLPVEQDPRVPASAKTRGPHVGQRWALGQPVWLQEKEVHGRRGT
ncbi:unnamed protein product [Macrosiphum euphorbiae]|uniref:Uncharacterized protein n=1 Tax=Macrosiphum euphorbiae TaxID=13131 RepID=A0AAV0XPL8_9HEMI|nr:unnamed protein product [Macrosiphum euphorbiae]